MSAPKSGNTLPPWMRELVEPFRSHAFAALALGLLAFGCSTLLMFTSGYLISRTAQAGTTLFMVMVPVALVQVFGLGRPIARYFERLVSHDFVFRITSNVRSKLFRAIEAQAGSPAHARETGQYLELLTDDIGHLQNLYLRVAFPTAIAYALFVAASVFCGLFSLELGLIVFACGALAAVLLPIAALMVARPLQKRAKAARSAEYARITDDILGASDWAIAGRGADAKRIHHVLGSQSRQADASVRRLVRFAEFASSLVLGLGACAITVMAAASFQHDSDAVNLIAAFTLGFFPLVEAFALLPGAFVESTAHMDAITRLDGIIEGGDDAQMASGPAIDRPASASIELQNALFAYPSSTHPALNHLSIVIPSGQKLAVLGPSGSGKTTFAAVLRGMFRLQEGELFIINQHGNRLPAEGRELVGYIPQTPYLFDQSLRNNLALGKPDATDDELVSALRRVGLAEKYDTLGKGLDTRIGETGTGFSGGEAHRLALARALLADYPIVLLDEPFTALDPATERNLLDTLFEAFDGKTLVVITHHLAGIEQFDRVVFIEQGTVKLDGSPHDLARDEPKFRQLLSFDRELTNQRDAPKANATIQQPPDMWVS